MLACRTKSIPGAAIEHNKFCVSVHFRNCEADRLEDVLQAVEAVLAKNKELKATRGRKVLEIRPQVLALSCWHFQNGKYSLIQLCLVVLPFARLCHGCSLSKAAMLRAQGLKSFQAKAFSCTNLL